MTTDKPVRSRLRRAGRLGLLLGVAGAGLSLVPWTLFVEEIVGLGALFAARGPMSAPDVAVIAGVSRDAAGAVGQTTELDTWPRSLHAELVDALAAAGAGVIVFDLVFDEPRDAAADQAFAEAIARAGNVLLLERTETKVVELGGQRQALLERRAPPLPAFQAHALATAPFVLPTVPIRVAQFWTFGRAASDTPSLPAVAVQAHLLPYYDDFRALVARADAGAPAGWPASAATIVGERNLGLTMGKLRRTFESRPGLARTVRAELERTGLPPASASAARVLLDLYGGAASRYLNLYGPARALTTVPYDLTLRKQAPIDFKDKVVFVGLSESRQSEQQDDFYSVFSQRTGINLSGVEIGATIFANLLERRALVSLPLPAQLALLLTFGLLIAGLAAVEPVRRALLALVAGGLAYAAIAYWLFASRYLWLPLVVPLLLQLPVAAGVALWWSYRQIAAQRERVREALAYYLPQPVARRLAQEAVAEGARNELLHGTCLVTDAEEYTAVAETLRPDQLAALMNDYYATIFGVVQRYGGEISDTAGDSMIAVWATVEPDTETRSRAAQAALAILEAVDVFNASQPIARLPTRIGLESGEMLLGNIGGQQRYEYRAIGDIVNTAARIQSLNRLLGTRVLISGATLAGMTSPRTRLVGTFLLRGKRSPVTVYEPVTAALALDEDGLAAFAAALARFHAGDWHNALDGFAALEYRFPQDGPSRYYAALTTTYAREPPANWAGVIRVELK
jgi:adenylate cyclase